MSIATSVNAAPSVPSLAGNVAIVTGASAGIGRACVHALAAAGMKVVPVARRMDKLVELKAELVATGVDSGCVLPLQCDVTSEDDIKSAIVEIEKDWGALAPCVLVNSAGLSLEDTAMLNGTTSSWRQMLDTNVIAVAVFTREVVAAMKRHGTPCGHIVNISSTSAYRIPSFTGGAFYAATKHALRCISDGMRAEAQQLGIPLRVTCISPGVVESEFYVVRHFGNAKAATSAYNYQALQPKNVADAVVYALSAPSSVNVDDVILRSVEQMG